MNESLVRIHAENFKSLKDFTIECKKFNVLIGPNGSGKTNVLELFKFANLCIDPVRIPAYPFRSWSGFNNIVWSHNTDLPIRLQVNYRVEKHNIEYKMTVDGASSMLEFLDEELSISNYIHVLRNYKSVKYRLDTKFLAMIKSELSAASLRLPHRFSSDISSWKCTTRQIPGSENTARKVLTPL